MQSTPHTNAASSEQFLTKKLAAATLNLPYYKIQRATKLKLIPTYRLLDSREYVKLSGYPARHGLRRGSAMTENAPSLTV